MTRDYSKYSKEELIDELKTLQKRKKYGLVWEDKPEDVVEQCKKELPVLEEVKSKEIITDNDKPTNILIEGDNYHALSVLNYTHKGKIDVIYIDPPYNTGAKDWKYNNDYVDSEDPYRHSKWISFLHHRINLAKNLLKPSGIICITVDDYEMPRLWMLMEEVFGETNNLGIVAIRNNPKGRKTERKISLIHEYAIFFGRSNKAKISKIPKDPALKTHNYKKDENGNWYLPVNLRKQGVDSLAVNKKGKLSERYYPIYVNSKTGVVSTIVKYDIEILPIDSNGQKRIWRRSKDVIDDAYNKGELWYQKTKSGDQLYYKFKGGLDGEPPQSMWYDSKFSASEHGTQLLDQILGEREKFQYPKSPYAVEECIKSASSDKNAVILDFFAGSGTTGQAVFELNKEDGGTRKFILCTNNENKIAEEICYPRIKNIINGYKNFKGVNFEGYNGNLRYFKTSFVPADPTDKNKTKLTMKAAEMLCMKEDTFEEVVSNTKFKIYKNNSKYTGIVLDHQAISEFKQEIKKVNKKVNVYIFSLGDDTFDEEFEDIKSKVKLSPIPEAILRVYRRIFK